MMIKFIEGIHSLLCLSYSFCIGGIMMNFFIARALIYILAVC